MHIYIVVRVYEGSYKTIYVREKSINISSSVFLVLLPKAVNIQFNFSKMWTSACVDV
jgi:hypothetical protein